jgi:hypothetical protein
MSQDTQPGDLLPKFEEVQKRLDDGDTRMGRIEQNLTDNTNATARIEANTSDLVEAFANLKGAFKVLNWIGKFAKPLGYIAGLAAAVVSLYTAFKAGTTIK